MSAPIITVENLGKKYRLDHQVQRQRYTALRDVIADKAKRLFRAPFARRKDPNSSGRTEEFWALKDVSFEVKQGEVVGIIGRNGAGKSTLLKILSRITEPTAGRVRLRGRVASLLEVGTGFHPELTGRENIYLNGAILGMTRAEIRRKFDEIVAFAEVEKFLDTPVKRYSSGMYVRLAFAVAAHLEPEILVVDEVLAVGDAAFQRKCLGKMGHIANQGRTVIFVSHTMSAIGALCQSAILLRRGKVVSLGPATSVVNEYLASLHDASAILDRRNKLQNSSGDAGPKVVTAAILGADGRRCTRFAHGSAICFAFSLAVNPPHPPPRCVILVQTSTAIPVLHLTSDGPLDWQAMNRKGEITVYCTMPKCSLYPGDYVCSIWIGCGHQPIQFVQDALAFRIELGGALLAAGFDISWNNGLYHCETQWRTSGDCLSESVGGALE
jgi:lipopolysaccharide transport system ATP-binding protein